jgi:hypothetical protein
MIIVNGMRSGDDFISKKYKSSNVHQLYKIDQIDSNNQLVLKDSRYQGEGIDNEV